MAYEVEESEDYLRKVAERLAVREIEVETITAHGEPAEEIVRQAEERRVDLIAMATHGHRWFYDLVFGSVSEEVRHKVSVPVLLIRSHTEPGVR